ncbi:MAG: sugar ABC transporter permease [Clostridia bacterium]|nr:sugar ABC transporter permease [Clostridia bacterium]
MLSIKEKFKKFKRSGGIAQSAFLIGILAVPVTCFLIFYVAVNFNSIIMAFQSYDTETSKFYFDGFVNFKEFFSRLSLSSQLKHAIRNSAVIFVLNVCISMPLCMFVSYCITEKVPLFGFFKVVLFIPSILSTFALTMVGRQAITYILPKFFGIPFDVLVSDKQFFTVTMYDLYMGFSANMILYMGAMSSVSKEVLEYSQIDGCGFFGRFIHVVIPSIFPTVTTLLIVQVTNFFVSYGSMFSFTGQYANDESYTLGYYLFIMIYKASGSIGTMFSYAEYPLAAAMGVSFTLVAIPIVLGIRYLLQRFGPSEN